MKMMKKKISELKPHPKNEEIYGYDEDVSDLVEKIRRSKDVHTLTINSNNVILAGHRRRKACMQLGIKEVNVEVRNFDTEEEELEFIIDNNSTREKTAEQKAREARSLKEIESVLAEKRRLATQNNYSAKQIADTPKLAEQVKGEARDIVAKKVGLKSGHEVDRAIKTVAVIDELEQKGEKEKAELIRGVLNNRSISTAEELAKHIDEVEIPENEVESIKSGKKSPYTYVEEIKEKKKPKIKVEEVEVKKCNDCGKLLSLDHFYTGKSICRNCCEIKDRERKERNRVFRDVCGNELKIDKEKLKGVDLNAIMESVKEDKTKNVNKIDYEMEIQLFDINVNDFIFKCNKYINQNILDDIPVELKENFHESLLKMEMLISQLKNKIN